jgi:hypothetical protein
MRWESHIVFESHLRTEPYSANQALTVGTESVHWFYRRKWVYQKAPAIDLYQVWPWLGVVVLCTTQGQNRHDTNHETYSGIDAHLSGSSFSSLSLSASSHLNPMNQVILRRTYNYLIF